MRCQLGSEPAGHIHDVAVAERRYLQQVKQLSEGPDEMLVSVAKAGITVWGLAVYVGIPLLIAVWLVAAVVAAVTGNA
jgi:hypothetical protein